MTPYAKFVRTSGYVDLGLFAVLATPFLSVYLLELLFQFGVFLGDVRPVPDLSSVLTNLAINLVGVLGVFTAWLRISPPNARLLPSIGSAIGVMKIGAALIFGVWVFLGAPLVLLALLAADVCVGSLLLFRKSQ